MKNQLVQRESNIELLRILGCLIVIATHIKESYIIQGSLDNKKLLIASFLCDGVNIFWIIMGFFIINNNKTIFQSIKKSIRRIVLPAILFCVAMYLLQDWLLNEVGILKSVLYSRKSWGEFIHQLTTWTGFILPLGGHLWYVVWYMKNLILWVPIINMIFSNEANKTEKKVIFSLCCVTIILADIVVLLGKDSTVVFRYFSIWGGGDLLVSPFLIILGYILYKMREKFQKNKQWLYVGIIIFCSANIIRYYMQKKLIMLDLENVYFLMWYAGISIISSCGITISFLHMSFKGDKIGRWINYIAGYTYGIYLLHVPVHQKLISLGINDKIKKIGDIGYVLIYTIVVFSISLFVSIFLRMSKEKLCCLLQLKQLR